MIVPLTFFLIHESSWIYLGKKESKNTKIFCLLGGEVGILKMRYT